MLKNDVVSKEVAKELQEAGIELGANWYHHKDYLLVFRINESMCICYLKKGNGWYQEKFYYDMVDDLIPTYTLDQMLRELPWKIEHGECEKKHTRNCIHTCIGSFFRLEAADEKEYHAEYLCLKQYVHNRGMEVNDNPATACAKLLLWCKKNGYVK